MTTAGTLKEGDSAKSFSTPRNKSQDPKELN